MEFEYEQQIKQARARLEAIASATFTIASAVQVIATTLIQEHAPKEIEFSHADIVEAGQHARSTIRTLADLAEQAKEAAKGLSAVNKEVEKIDYGTRRLLADLLQRADAEEQRRREEERERQEREAKRQQDMPIGGAPKSSPGAETMSADDPRLPALFAEALRPPAPGALIAQTAAAALPRYLEAAREQARQDAARGLRCETAGDLSTALDLPEEMGEHLPKLWAAYEETAAAAAPKGGKKRKEAKS